MSYEQNLVIFVAAMLAGAVNSVAGGGTLLTFPALLWVGYGAVVANATSTVALWPGQLSSLWGYRTEIGRSQTAIVALAIPSLLGGILGAYLLLHTSESNFKAIVPFLILMATVLFMLQEPLSRFLRSRSEISARAGAAVNPLEQEETPYDPAAPQPSPLDALRVWGGVMGFQFLVAIYGGYFGAGIGILMLAALGFMGMTNIHRMNGLKNINGLCINAVAAIMFIADRLVDWRIAALMAAGSIVGGYSGAGTARRIGQRNVRRIIIVIGFALTISLLIKR
jgi:uncharacterized membrane protein YfcA